MTAQTLHGHTIFNSDYRSLRYLYNRVSELKIGLLPVYRDSRIYFYFVYSGRLLFESGPDYSFPNCMQALKAAKEISQEIPF